MVNTRQVEASHPVVECEHLRRCVVHLFVPELGAAWSCQQSGAFLVRPIVVQAFQHRDVIKGPGVLAENVQCGHQLPHSSVAGVVIIADLVPACNRSPTLRMGSKTITARYVGKRKSISQGGH
jgi:hypothetical protein